MSDTATGGKAMTGEELNRKYATGPKNGNWNGGIHATVQGYIEKRTSLGVYKREHREIAEKALGKELDSCHPVHHHDEDKTNNTNGNLVICEDDRYHFLLHLRTEVLRAGYDPNVFKKCAGFGSPHYTEKTNFGTLLRMVDQLNYSCKACCRIKGNRGYRQRKSNAGH